MIQRDKDILSDLERFRVLDRDLIASLHFAHTKNPITHTNSVMKRLRRDKYVTAATDRRKYLYFPAEKHIKKDSQKINHFLAIAHFFNEIRQIDTPKVFTVEPKFGGKGTIEPDVFMIFCGHAFMVEIQLTHYSDKTMKEKLNRYENYFLSGEWQKATWQPEHKKVQPMVWIYGKDQYNIGVRSFRVFQEDVEGMKRILVKK